MVRPIPVNLPIPPADPADPMRIALDRINELEAALYKAHGILGGLSMGTEGHMRKRICTAYNVVGKPLGKGRSSHGDPNDE